MSIVALVPSDYPCNRREPVLVVMNCKTGATNKVNSQNSVTDQYAEYVTS